MPITNLSLFPHSATHGLHYIIYHIKRQLKMSTTTCIQLFCSNFDGNRLETLVVYVLFRQSSNQVSVYILFFFFLSFFLKIEIGPV